MTPLERAAQAVQFNLLDQIGRGGISYDISKAEDQPAIHEYRGRLSPVELARAVMRAIREPSEAMREAHRVQMERCLPPDGCGQLPDHAWQAMIDAALEEG